MSDKARIGVFNVGFHRYWPQFPGLRERLDGYRREFEERISGFGAEVVSAGLVDTVEDYDGWKRGNGFLFGPLDPAALVVATRRALDVWRDVRAWRGIQERGMAIDFSWGKSAERYEALYQGLVGA